MEKYKTIKDVRGRSPKRIKVNDKKPADMTDAEVLKELAEIREYYVSQGYTG